MKRPLSCFLLIIRTEFRVLTASVGNNGVHELMPVRSLTGFLAGSTVLGISSGCKSDHDLSQAEMLPGWALLFGAAASAGISS